MKQVSKNVFANDLQSFRALFGNSEENSSSKLGIIFEGGALRGVISCGYALAIRELVSESKYYRLYGSSSGALNSIYFITNQIDIALSIYSENATDKRCTDIWRFPNILNVDWLIDNWIFGKKAFDYQKIIKSNLPSCIVGTNMNDGDPTYFLSSQLSYETLNRVMKATSYAPLLTNEVQVIDGTPYGDGAVSDALPYRKAIEDGCTHIICLLTRPPTYRKGRRGLVNHWLKVLRLMSRSAAYRKSYWEGEIRYNERMEELYAENSALPPMLIISPADKSEHPSNIETRPRVIQKMGERAYHDAKNQLVTLFPELMP